MLLFFGRTLPLLPTSPSYPQPFIQDAVKSALDDNIGSLMQDIVNGANAECWRCLVFAHTTHHPPAALRGLHIASLCSFPFLADPHGGELAVGRSVQHRRGEGVLSSYLACPGWSSPMTLISCMLPILVSMLTRRACMSSVTDPVRADGDPHRHPGLQRRLRVRGCARRRCAHRVHRGATHPRV